MVEYNKVNVKLSDSKLNKFCCNKLKENLMSKVR